MYSVLIVCLSWYNLLFKGYDLDQEESNTEILIWFYELFVSMFIFLQPVLMIH